MSEADVSKPAGFESTGEAAELASTITGDAFDAWYREYQHAQNIREGTPYFNGPPAQQPSKRHSPSKLLQCHRKAYYRHFNAPQETEAPDGIFWFGDQFESEIAVPFLQSLVGENRYVRNSMWIDVETTVDGEDIRIRGETDPVVVDRESTPVLLTEIKTTSSVDHLDSPKRHHTAQIHAYLHGLSAKHDTALRDAVILYGARDSFAVKTFHVEFDPEFWQTLLERSSVQTAYRSQRELPAAAPVFDWECQYCDYRHRCGQAETASHDTGVRGLLPLFDEYPKPAVVDYLDGHDGARLTPTLAYAYPELATRYGVYDWVCQTCETQTQWDAVDWDGDTDGPPVCPDCAANGTLATLRGPAPADQQADPEVLVDA